MTFDEFVARKDAARAERNRRRVTWRKVSAMTGGGWSGLGPGFRLCFVRPAATGDLYEYGVLDGPTRVVKGTRPTLRAAKDAAAAALISPASDPDPEEGP